MPATAHALEADTLDGAAVNPEAAAAMGVDAESGMPRIDTLRFSRPRTGYMTDPFPRRRSPLIEIHSQRDEIRITLDSLGHYSARRMIHDVPAGFTRTMDFETFSELSFRHTMHSNWKRLVEEKRRQREARRGLLDFTIDLPVGERSAFTTIFGRPEVNLRVTGTANMNVGASIQDTENPSLPPDQQRTINPTFEQNLRLNIQGTIGDKLTIQTDWDTERTFDFENRMSIRYDGYEDEIIRSIEMGNVSMQTGNSLIRGGSALFGIKSEAKFGPLSLTSVVSQQEGQGNTQTITGGSQASGFEIRPAAYDNDRHFFLDFFARQEYEEAMSDPNNPTQMFQIQDIEVYVLNTSSQERPGQVRAAALVDLGVTRQGDRYLYPNEAGDPFDPDLIDEFRDPGVTPSADDFGVSADAFDEGNFEPLERGIDYVINQTFGYISLDSRLGANQALAVSFSYIDPAGNVVRVGDINTGDGRRMFLKLLRPSYLTTSSSAWVLTMRNIYNLNATNLNPDNFDAEIVFDGANTAQTNLPGLGNVLMQDLGLDRVNSQGQPSPNNQIDFGTGTLDAVQGRIIFPFLEPFGQRIIDIYQASNLPQDQITENIDRYAFPDLYTNTQQNARQEPGNNLFLISGKSQGMTQDSYNLGFALVEGSVRVRANGVELSEGVDYEVDYNIGNIIITNDRYLQSGQEIVIDYESNQMLQIQQTTFAGLRAEYRVNDNIRFGSTWFTLRERPLQDKIPIGDEPINNSIIGFDGTAEFDTPWMTRAINWLPLLQTRSDSDISISGEFAQLRPNVAQTRAVSRAMDRGELYSDEERGLSFIDDFEGSKTSINFLSPGRWQLAAAPHAVPGFDQDMDMEDNSMSSRLARADLRGKFSWYMIPVNIGRITDAARTPESLPLSVSDVFPNREVLRQEDRLQTLDIHYHPRKRGPYNYNTNLRDLLENRPEDTWGGMTAVLPSGLDNLRQNNIEFLEFWVQPILPDGAPPGSKNPADYDGKIYIDLGLVSEDVIPNNRLNTEDGLVRAVDRANVGVDANNRSRIIETVSNLTGQFSVETQDREDVGLDGIHSTEGDLTEQQLFADWLELMEIQYDNQPEILQQILSDPSNDRYFYFNDPLVSDKPLHERFHRMYGFLEGNSLTRGESRAITNRPDTEGLINPATVQTSNSYFQFEVPLNPADESSLQIGSNYIVDKVEGNLPTERWYLVRIPLRDVARQVGAIEDLERVQHIRFWMSGYREPFTMRFATFELVGNQWREFEELALEGHPGTVFDISTINIEENSNREPIPYRIPNGAIRSVQRGQQENILANEQSLSLRVEDLRSGEYRMIQRLYPSGLNLLNYSNMRMFVHGEGYERRSDAEVVIRLGNDLTNNYYEYRQPVTPTDPGFEFTPLSMDPDASVLSSETDRIWLPDSNSVNLVLASMNALKQARNLAGVDDNELYERRDLVQDAPPGTVIAIRGNPSLERVREIGIGVRNPHQINTGSNGANGGSGSNGSSFSPRIASNAGKPSLDAELWVNELRVSGFDDEKGWAANVRSTIRMADFATVQGTFRRQTDGFGPLDASLGNRQMRDEYSYDLSTTVNMHRFIPERYGWSLPVALSARHSRRTPRFLAREGDIRFSDFKEAVEASDLPEEEQERQIQAMLDEIRTQTQRYSLNMSNISKQNSESGLLRYTVDNITLGYVVNMSEESDPRTEFRDAWDYRVNFNYQLSIRNVDVVRPLWFLEPVPVLRWFAGTGFTYVPSRVSLRTGLTRRYSEERQRSFNGDPFDLRQTHTFNTTTNFNLDYNFTQSISLGFSNQLQLNLEPIGEIRGGPESDTDFPFDPGEDNTPFDLVPTFRVLEDWVMDPAVSPRRDSYQESWSASWRPRLNQIEGLDWFSYSTSFQGSFNWQNSPEGSGLGSNLANSFSFNHNPELQTQSLLRKIPFYDSAVEAHEQERRRRTQDRARSNSNGDPSERNLSDDLTHYARSMLLGVLSIQNINVTYNIGGSSTQSGYAGESQIFYMFNEGDEEHFSPPFGYRIGIFDRIPDDGLIRNQDPTRALNLRGTDRSQNQFNLRSGLRPFPDFRVTLNWQTNWSDTKTRSRTLVFPDSVSTQLNHSGDLSTSAWAFGGGYNELFELQLDRALARIGQDSEIRNLDPGEIPLTRTSLEKDVRKAYLGFASGTIGDRGYMPLPLPNWQISWSGWEKKFGFLDRFLQSATINHSYSGTYRMGWQLNLDRGNEISQSLGSYTFIFERPEFHSQSINLERSFSPLVGLQLNWVNNLRTQIQYNRTRAISITLTNNTIRDRQSQGLTSSVSYSKRGFRIPFFRQLNNQIDFSLSMSYSGDITYIYRLNEDVADAVRLSPEERAGFVRAAPDEQGSATLQIRPSVKYQFSRSINAGFEYSFSKTMPRSTGVFPRTDQDIRFNIQVSIRSN